MNRNRRQFLAEVGQGMLVASVGSALAVDLGFASRAFAEGSAAGRLTFGELEPLVALMQDTQADKLLPLVVGKLKSGTELRTVVAAAALANARTFGGHDYDGYHTFMALTPAYQMAQELPDDRRALPVLKVLHRNARFIEKFGGSEKESLHVCDPVQNDKISVESLRDCTRQADQAKAEKTLALLAKQSPEDAYNAVQMAIEDDVDVHRVVLSWRAWATLDLTGKEQAATLLRQSVRYCVDSERSVINKKRAEPGVRATLTKLLDQYRLIGKSAGTRRGDDGWIENLCQAIYAGNRDQAAEAVAAALAEGMDPADVGEAISLAANRLVLRDPGRIPQHSDKQRPEGSVHGASVGVHASDSANAWRNIAKVSNQRNAVASLIVGGYHTAGQAGMAGQKPLPWPEHLEGIKTKDAKELLTEAENAIKAKDQIRVSALIHRYGELGHSPRQVFDLMLKYAISEDGALHAEKYYRTVGEEFASTRESMKWRHLVALARVTASEYGFPAPGYAEACQLVRA
jgi:hypothetical protein